MALTALALMTLAAGCGKGAQSGAPDVPDNLELLHYDSNAHAWVYRAKGVPGYNTIVYLDDSGKVLRECEETPSLSCP